MSAVESPATPAAMEHQEIGISWLKERPTALLADEPGLGKSRQLLEAATEPILVVAPAMVLDSGTWDDEVAKWAPGADVTQVSYSSLTAREKTPKGGSRPTDRLKPEYQGRWGTVIADEAHYLKGRSTTWTKAFKRLESDRTYQATGTPIPNWAHEAFVALQLIYPDDAVPGGRLGSYWRWVGEWFDVEASRWNPQAKEIGGLQERWTWADFYEQNWGDRMLLRLRKDCLDLPPLTLSQWKVQMGPAQRRVYKALKADFVAWLENGTEVAAWSSAAQLVKLAKCSTGLDVLDSESKGSGKLDALRTILSDRPRPTLVVGHFRDTVAACARVAEEVGATVRVVDGGVSRGNRREAVRAFQSGSLDVMCATLDTVSEGMTLHQGGADQVVRVERSWKPSRNEQILRRLHRLGVERPITAIDLVTEDSVDEGVLALLEQKTDQQMQALGLVDLKGVVGAR